MTQSRSGLFALPVLVVASLVVLFTGGRGPEQQARDDLTRAREEAKTQKVGDAARRLASLAQTSPVGQDAVGDFAALLMSLVDNGQLERAADVILSGSFGPLGARLFNGKKVDRILATLTEGASSQPAAAVKKLEALRAVTPERVAAVRASIITDAYPRRWPSFRVTRMIGRGPSKPSPPTAATLTKRAREAGYMPRR